jgi:hypothetical protein
MHTQPRELRLMDTSKNRSMMSGSYMDDFGPILTQYFYPYRLNAGFYVKEPKPDEWNHQGMLNGKMKMPRSKLRGILTDVKHPQETSHNGGCRP